ncbi:MAG TPA: DUF1501 domain-containing protein [Pirellulaceae bacterium]|nr:DUF1501 domain-containing protein [Pirellulaceae bacterium]
MMGPFSRRRFLASVAAASTTSGLVSLAPQVPWFLADSAALGAQAGATGEKILVVVQLSGGNDGLNTVIPFRDERYIKARPSLKFDENSVLKIDADTGFHPSLKGLTKLLEAQQLSIVQGVGYPNPNRSHFESMDIWHTARNEVGGDRTAGWIGRGLDSRQEDWNRTPDPGALHLGEEVQPLALLARAVPVPSIRSLEQFQLDLGGNFRLRQSIESAAGASRSDASELLKFVQTRTTSALEVSRRIEATAKDYKTPVVYPETGLAHKLKQAAQLIDAGLSTRVYYVALDGFDTHSQQADAHSGLLLQLGDALAAFAEDLQTHGHLERVTTLVFSEFGRRLAENASQGTDHGAAAPVFLVGSKVKAGLVGKHPSTAELDDGDVKFAIDFRAIYSALLTQWLNWPAAAILGGEFQPAEVLKA